MSIYSLRAAYRPGHWEVPEFQSSKNKERTQRVLQMALPIITALGVLVTVTLALAIPIAIGIAIGAIYFYRKNPEPTQEPAKVSEPQQNNQDRAPPPYAPPEAPPAQNASPDAPPPYQNESRANDCWSFWDPSPYWSKNENQVSKSEVEAILHLHGGDLVNVSLRLSQKKAEAFLQYVQRMTRFSEIGTYRREDRDGYRYLIFSPLPAEQQLDKKPKDKSDLLAYLENNPIAPPSDI